MLAGAVVPVVVRGSVELQARAGTRFLLPVLQEETLVDRVAAGEEPVRRNLRATQARIQPDRPTWNGQ